MTDDVWRKRARFGDLRSVMDPADASGSKNMYIDLVQKNALERHFHIGAQDTVLDFGCGVGRFTDWLEARAHTVIGIDASPEMVAAARRLHPGSRCQWLTSADERLPLADASVDRILSVWVLQHVLDNARLEELIAEFSRVLKPGGATATIEQVDPAGRTSVPGYIEQRNARDYEKAFRAAGFRVDRSQPIRVPSRAVNAILRLRLPRAAVRLMAASASTRRASKATYVDQLMVFIKPDAT
jgi:ubiquinone/menaquinone biosynthesis C-methylase UbiE